MNSPIAPRFAPRTVVAAAAFAIALPIALGAVAQKAPNPAQSQNEFGDKPTSITPRDYGVTEGQRRDAKDPIVVGAFVYSQRCAVCHSRKEGGLTKYGPHLEGIVGRKAAATNWPQHTDALKESDIVWDEGALKAMMRDPKKALPGMQMDVKIRFKRSRTALMEYLKTL